MIQHSGSLQAEFAGLRMTAEEFLRLPEDGCNYELIDGVVMMTPSPAPVHQAVRMEVLTQLGLYLREHPLGQAFPEIDVHLGSTGHGEDIVYRPELAYIRAERLSSMREQITGPPDVVMEIVSRGSRRFDTETKLRDYERFGVGEYWLIDPERLSMVFLRLKDGRFEPCEFGDQFLSTAVPGFSLDLVRVRAAFNPW